jgi:hypothetical protein
MFDAQQPFALAYRSAGNGSRKQGRKARRPRVRERPGFAPRSAFEIQPVVVPWTSMPAYQTIAQH